MALSEFERKKAEKAIAAFLEKRRPPPHIRPKLDIGYRITGQSVELFEIRPRWDKPTEKLEHPIAKATYTKTSALWKIYWRSADLKWHSYEPVPRVGSLEKFLEVVDQDRFACFFG
jgi:Protein of unknown function (DUF3024)